MPGAQPQGPIVTVSSRHETPMASLRNLAISLLRFAGFTSVARGLRWAAWDHTRALALMGL